VNRDLRLELTSTGELIVKSPTGSKMGIRNANLTAQLTVWSNVDQGGYTFDYSALFALPNRAHSPDAAWIKRERCDQLSDANRNELLQSARLLLSRYDQALTTCPPSVKDE